MTLSVYTARVDYAGPDRLDVTRKSAGPEGLPFAPSWAILGPILNARRGGPSYVWPWPGYVRDYTAEMRRSFREHSAAWSALLARDEVTLVCYCSDAVHCHRAVLAEILVKLGATYHGERP